ncbi:unnamed protein product [Symbiodinium natans]|uniref:Uncharacterized protein n=1 Tax=Symbiodinium natans TaxID=878477 RepID=A0A812SHB1_9DINO|nr:unnamed protein product [Symbiodinium natans]
MAILAVMLREDPCRNFLDGAVPFYPELSVFGHAPPLQPEEAWSLKGSTARSCTPFVKRRAKSAHVAAKAGDRPFDCIMEHPRRLSHLIAIGVRIPAVVPSQNTWDIGTFSAGGAVLDASCTLTAPFMLLDSQVNLLAASALQAQWTSDTSKSIFFLGFELSRQASATVMLRAPFGLRPAGARCSSALQLQGVPAGYVPLPVGSRSVTCLAGGGQDSAFSGRAAALLEGIIELEVVGATLLAGTMYAFGVELRIPAGLLYQNTWFLAVGGQAASFEGADLMRVETAKVEASFPGLALRSTGPLPYNDVQMQLTFGANVSVLASILLVIPPVFVAGSEDIVCAPFQNFSIWHQGDSCKLLNGSHAECGTSSCIQLAARNADESDQVWLLRGAVYVVTVRVQNPAACNACSPPWQVILKLEQVTWSSEAQGFQLVGEVADFVVEPSHRLGDSSVLLTVRIDFVARLLLHDQVVFTVPPGWELDPLFCESPVAQAAMLGLKAPPICSSTTATLTVYEMDLPPLSNPQLQLRLEGMAPEFGLWQAKRTEWLSILQEVSTASALPFEFSVEVRRRSGQSVLTVSAGKVQAYEVMPNMAPNCELAISSASLASLAAMRLSLRPSESVNAYVNSIWIRSSLPYDFRGCSLLWEEPAARAASRPEDPAFRFAGEPSCVGQLNELTLFGVLLDTSIKDQVTLYVANFTVPRPPYVAKESRWEVALLRSRSGLAPIKEDHGIGLPGPGAFGGLVVSAEQFYSNLEAGAVNELSFHMRVTVPLLQDSVLRVILPPGFTLQQFDYFEGVSRHFARNPAASAVMTSRSNMTEVFGSDAPDGMVEILMLRILVDSSVEELLEFRIRVRNPTEELPEMYQDLNRWLVETLDATSGLVVNSNKLSWVSFEPRPGFLEATPVPQESLAGAATRVTLVLRVTSLVRFMEAAPVMLEVWAPPSYLLEANCLGNGSTTSSLPFAQTCNSFGRLAQVTGTLPAELTVWEREVSYELNLGVAQNGDLASNSDNSWQAQLWQVVPANVSDASEEVPLTVGPAIVVRDAAVWQPGAVGLESQILRTDDRLLVIDTTWLETKGLVVGASEAAVLLADGRFGKTAAAALRNAPADDRPRPLSRADLKELVHKTSIGGYRVQGATAAFGVGARYPTLPDWTSFVAGLQLGFATTLRLASIRISAPPHFVFSCEQLEPGNTRLAWASAALPCRVVVSPFESAMFLQGAQPGGPNGYAAGMHWWFGGLVRLEFRSGWPEERQHWEVELSDETGDLRLSAVPQSAPEMLETWLLDSQLQPRFTGTGDTTLVDLTFAIRFFDPEDATGLPPQDIWNATTQRLQLFVRGPRSVPFDRAQFAEGSCIEAGDDIFFPDDSYLGRPPAACTRLSFHRQLQDLTEVPATSVAPRRLQGQLRMALKLTSLCRPPMPRCSDFFALQLGQERPLYARDAGLAAQLEAGEIGTEQAVAPRVQVSSFAFTVSLLLLEASA